MADWNVLLSDGFTRAVRIDFDHRTYYLQRHAGGNIIGENTAGLRTSPSGVRAVDDTVRVTAGAGLTLARWPSGDSMRIGTGELMGRVVRWQDRVLISRIGGLYAWISAHDLEGAVEKAGHSPSQPRLDVANIVRTFLSGFNETSRIVTTAFNRANGTDLSASQWTLREMSATQWLVVVERGPSMPRSTEELAGKLRTLLAGESMAVQLSGSEIVIRKP